MTSRYWPFTWNNYSQEDCERLQNLDPKVCKYIIYGKEIAPENGTPHLQGYVEWVNPIRFLGCKKLLDPIKGKDSIVHVGDKDGKPSNAAIRDIGILYCKKGGQSHEEWSEYMGAGPNFGKNADVFEKYFKKPREGQGKRTDWIKLRDFIKDKPDFSEVLEEYPEYAIKYTNGVKAAINAVNKKKQVSQLLTSFENKNLRPWQARLDQYVKGPSDDRKIIWYVDTQGGKGKSWLAKYLVAQGNCAYFTNAKTADVVHAYNGESIAIFNFARSCEGRINYNVIEDVKDGIMFSSKYDSSTKVFSSPHVVVFANFYPELKALSEDRWDIRILDEVETTAEVPITDIQQTIEVAKDNTQLQNLAKDENTVQGGNTDLDLKVQIPPELYDNIAEDVDINDSLETDIMELLKKETEEQKYWRESGLTLKITPKNSPKPFKKQGLKAGLRHNI